MDFHTSWKSIFPGIGLDCRAVLCYLIVMFKTKVLIAGTILLACLWSISLGSSAQSQRQVQAPDENAYGSKFFDQLHSIFGKFRDTDLKRAFQTAEPVRCSELVSNKGEWRTVAFFNEDRSLGEWCRESIEEVKRDLSVYIFKGTCRGEQGPVQLSTEFPVNDSIDAYNAGKIELDQVDINVNEPVSVTFDITAQAYTFDLPYLFLADRRNSRNVYSLISPHRGDRYATDVTNRWECKAVKSADVTYRFLICRSATVARKVFGRSQNREPAFGASAYFILSDGMEATSSVSISFGEAGHPGDGKQAVELPAPEPIPPSSPGLGKPRLIRPWRIPDAQARLAVVGKDEFRLRFASQTWRGRLASPQILYEQKMLSLLSAKLPSRADYCEWRPEVVKAAEPLLVSEPETDVSFSMTGYDKNEFSPASIVFSLKADTGVRLGTLQCLFPGAESATSIPYDRWVAIVGSHITLESRTKE
jgi:hypothetical protein